MSASASDSAGRTISSDSGRWLSQEASAAMNTPSRVRRVTYGGEAEGGEGRAVFGFVVGGRGERGGGAYNFLLEGLVGCEIAVGFEEMSFIVLEEGDCMRAAQMLGM